MLIAIALIAALICVGLLAFRPERRKQYNEFRRPAATMSGAGVFGDTSAGTSCGGDMGGGGAGCAGDGGGGGSC